MAIPYERYSKEFLVEAMKLIIDEGLSVYWKLETILHDEFNEP